MSRPHEVVWPAGGLTATSTTKLPPLEKCCTLSRLIRSASRRRKCGRLPVNPRILRSATKMAFSASSIADRGVGATPGGYNCTFENIR